MFVFLITDFTVEEDDIDEAVLRAVPVQSLIDREVDDWGLKEESLKSFDLNLA